VPAQIASEIVAKVRGWSPRARGPMFALAGAPAVYCRPLVRQALGAGRAITVW